MPTRLFLVSGRVQGVSFRATTREAAKSMGLVGWVRNLDDGRVEALATGDTDGLKRFEEFLWQGAPMADVTEVQKDDTIADESLSDFTIVR